MQELLDDTIVDGEYEEVNEGIHPTASYGSFINRPHSAKWGIEETRRFYEVKNDISREKNEINLIYITFDYYQCLQQCGTEYSLKQAFFPNRPRRHLKLKYFR